jgi:predicted lysophospholipase L1 biosynthesis ABC-type transport system permease subunit
MIAQMRDARRETATRESRNGFVGRIRNAASAVARAFEDYMENWHGWAVIAAGLGSILGLVAGLFLGHWYMSLAIGTAAGFLVGALPAFLALIFMIAMLPVALVAEPVLALARAIKKRVSR